MTDASVAGDGPPGGGPATSSGSTGGLTASVRRLRVGASSAVREFVRQPVNLVLLVVMPPVVVYSYGSMMAAFPRLPFMSADPETLGNVAGALFVAAFLPAVVGLFQVVSASHADARLGLAGFSPAERFTARLVPVVAAAVLAAGLAFAVLATTTEVAAPGAAVGALLAAGAIYGLIGMLVGTVLPRELEGSLVLVFLVDVDEGLASGIMAVESSLVEYLPLHHPHAVFEAAVTDGSVAGGDALTVVAYAAVLFVATLGASVLTTGGVGR